MMFKGDDNLHSIKVDKDKKRVLVRFYGYQGNEVFEYPEEFRNAIASINTLEYTLVLDATELKVIREEFGPTLVESIQIYRAYNFKKYYSVLSKYHAANMQVKRLVDCINFHFTFVDSLDNVI